MLLDGSILYTGLANREFLTFGYKLRNNRWGFREREFTPKKDKRKFRILVFGDSFTFGVGIDDNHRYSNSLEEMLKINNINSEVLNFGMGGYSTDQEHDLMKMILENVECDLVIIGFWLRRSANDHARKIKDLYLMLKKSAKRIGLAYWSRTIS